MLNHNICSTALNVRLQSTPCWPYLKGFTAWLAEKHFSHSTVQLYLFGIPALGQWLSANSIVISKFDQSALAIYRLEREESGDLYYRHARKVKAAFIGARQFQEYLMASGIVSRPPTLIPEYPLLSEFEEWMADHRGLKQSSLCCYARYIPNFVDALGENPDRYDALGVRRHFQHLASRSGVPTMQLAATAIRVFLRYLVATGQCDSSLPNAVPRIAHCSLSSLPRHLASEDVERLIGSCSELVTTALRDRAILLLLARLAFRAADVADLQHTDIDWRSGRIRVSGKGRRECWLPLTQELGDALAGYFLNERPEFEGPHFFIKSNAPRGPISARVVSSVVSRAVERTGIDAPSRGSHLLRHSAASAMLAHGASLEQIGSILRHVNVETTAIYAKIDSGLLRQVVPAWPAGLNAVDSDDSSTDKQGAGTC